VSLRVSSCLEHRHGQPEPLDDALHEPMLLPAGSGRSTQRDQQMVGLERANRIRERLERLVAADGSARVRAHLAKLSQHRSKPLVRPFVRRIGVGVEPVEAAGQRRRDDEHLGGRID
jgi:hypothetical protein